MLTTPHILTGIIIANKVKPIWLAAPLALISHQILDLIPHDDFDLIDGGKKGRSLVTLFKAGGLNINWRTLIVLIDALVGLSFALFFGLKFGDLPRYLLCAGLAIWSDLLRSLYYFLGVNNKAIKFVEKLDAKIFHNEEKSTWGKIVQLAIIIDVIAILFSAVDFPFLK